MRFSKLPKKRKYLPPNFRITVWSKLKPYFVELERRSTESKEELVQWVLDWNELIAVVQEDFAIRKVAILTNLNEEKTLDAYQYAIQELSPRIEAYQNQLRLKFLAHPQKSKLKEKQYINFIKKEKKALEQFEEVSLDLTAEIEIQSLSYLSLINKVHRKGKINEDKFNHLLNTLLNQRQKLAATSGYDNYRSYQFEKLSQKEYGVKESETFQDAIEKEILPVVEFMDEMRMEEQGFEKADQHFHHNGVEDFLEKCQACVTKIDSTFGESLQFLHENGRLDLEAKVDKVGGGFCTPMLFSGMPYLSLNPKDSFADLPAFMNQFGQAIHFLSVADYDLNTFKNITTSIKTSFCRCQYVTFLWSIGKCSLNRRVIGIKRKLKY